MHLFIVLMIFISSTHCHPTSSLTELMIADAGSALDDPSLSTISPATSTEYLLTEPTIETVEVTVTIDPLEIENGTEIAPIDFHSFIHRNPSTSETESDDTLPVPSILSEGTLAGNTGIMTVEPVLFPNWAPLSWPTSIRDFINTLARVPLWLIGSFVGQYAEIMGLQMMQVGNALLAAGVQGFGQ